MRKEFDTIVVGGGASGLTAAIFAARSGCKVLVLEQKDKLCKKIYATGNGKCNFTNKNWQAACFRGSDSSFAEPILRSFSFEDTAENLQNLAGKSILPTVFVAYSDVPLFISANCIRPHDCKQCAQDKKWFSLNKGKERYDVLSVPCQTILMNKKALYLGQHTNSIQADYIRIDLLYKKYDFADVNRILNAVKNKQSLPLTVSGNWQKRI